MLATAVVDRLAEIHDVAVVGHDDAEHQHLLAVVSYRVGGRVLEPTRDRRKVTELDHPAVGGDRHIADVVFAGELTADAHHTRSPRVSMDPRGHDAVLASQAFGNHLRA